MRAPALLLVPAVVTALAAPPPLKSREFAWETLWRRLTGAFSSERQSAEDPDYLDLRCRILPLWPARTDYRWLYVERAVPGLPGAPYRQTVYRLGDDPFGRVPGRRFEMLAFTVADPGRFAGASVEPARLEGVTPEDLVPRPGCAIVLARGDDGDFTGGTRGRGCVGDTAEVAYVTSEWTVGKDTLRVWDRAFDGEGRQVWGATKGPYLFRRLMASSSAETAP